MVLRLSAEIDIAVFIPENVDQKLFQKARDSGEYLFLPAYLAAFTWMFNPQVTDDVNIAGRNLRLDLHTIGMTWYGCIIHLNDPRIIAQNEWLLPLIGDMATNPVPIQAIVGCGLTVAQAPIANSLINLVDRYLATHDDPVLSSCLANFSKPDSRMVGGPTTLNDATNQCVSVQCQPSMRATYH